MILKSLNLQQSQLKTQGDGYEFEGYASVFGVVDSDGDVIEKGAFNFGEQVPKMFFNHLHMDLPIGKWQDATQDDNGLYVKGRLTKGNSQSEDIRASMLDGAIDGMSIGFTLKRDDYDLANKGKVIKNISNLFEISVVTFPANSAARIDNVKSELESIKSIQEFECFLRDSGSISRSVANALIAKAKQLFQREAEQEEEAKKLLLSIKSFRSLIK